MSYRQFDDERKVLPDLEIKPDLSEVVEETQECSKSHVDESPPDEQEEECLDADKIFVGVQKDEIKTIELDIPVEQQEQTKVRGKDKTKRKKREFTPQMAEKLAKSREVKLSKYRKKKMEAMEKMREEARQEGVQRYLKEQKDKQEKLEAEKREAKRIAPVTEAPRPSFEQFCNLMDKYHSYKDSKKAVAKKQTSSQPHPNKVVRSHHLPRPPLTVPSQVRVPNLLQVQNKQYNKWCL
jgi:hypothetical protein